MGKGRLEAFSDGVIAIIITIMVLELQPPHETSLGALFLLAPTFLSYLLSFIYVGIYWNNHHHLLHASGRINGKVMWANLHLLFWLSLLPFATAWMGESYQATAPACLYGIILLMAAVAYVVMQWQLVKSDAETAEHLRKALGRDHKGKASVIGYLLGIGLSFGAPWAAQILYVAVALLWLIPDTRIEKLDQRD
jgi:uncharacterized membrane protein